MKQASARTPNKGAQQRGADVRAPKNNPAYPRQIGAWVTEAQFQAFHRWGGSAALRGTMDALLRAEAEAQARVDVGKQPRGPA